MSPQQQEVVPAERSVRRILIVEDERIIAKDLQRTLIQLGYEVPAAVACAEDAIQRASEHCPDLVLMDIHIAGEHDGIETARMLRSRFDVPIVYLTAFADDETIDRAKQTEPHGYLVKPIKADELRAAVEVALYKHEMERRLRERERWFATTLRSIGDIVISTDPLGRVTFMNRAAEEFTGRRAEDARGRPFAEVFRSTTAHGVESLSDPIVRALRVGAVVHVDDNVVAGDGSERAIADSAAPIVAEDGRVLGAVLVFSDVTEEHKLQRQLELADRLASLGTMAAGVAHEINNPLAAVMANVEYVLRVVAKRRMGSDEPWLATITEALGDALAATQRVSKITGDLRQFSRPAEVSRDRCELKAAVEAAIRMTRQEVEASAHLEVSLAAVPAIACDETRLVQVLVNLLLNAAQALGPSPDDHEIRIASELRGDGVVDLRVTDNGPGIPADLLPRIFEPFVTTKVGRGNGLGLAICRGIVTSFGGDIAVESQLGQGSTFHLALPVAVEVAPVVVDAEEAAGCPRGHILVIDDEPMIRAVIQRALGARHDVTVAGTLAEARRLFGEGRRYDLVLCDIMLAEESGIDLYEELLRTDPGQASRVAFLTGGAFTARAAEFLASITNPVIEKPFSLAELNRRVDRLLVERSR